MKRIVLLFIFLCSFMLTACGKHETVYHPYLDSTCTSLGNEAYYECLDCQKYFSDDHKTELDKIPTIEMKEHDLHEVENDFGHLYSNECSCGYKEVIPELPVISISTLTGHEIEGNRESAEYYDTTISITNCDEKYALTDVEASVKVRGNYTANYDKKPYRIKFESKQMMLGLNNDLKAKNWVLLAEYKDRTLLKNATAFTLGNEILDEYTSDYRFVEVYVNGTYRGLYLLCEQQQVNGSRVNITEPEKNYEGVDIGYLVEMDSYYQDEKELERFEMAYQSLLYKDGTSCPTSKFVNGYSIKSDIYSEEQNLFIKKTMNNIFAIAYDTVYGNHTNTPYKTLDSNNDIVEDATIKSKEEAIGKIIDINSLVSVFLLNEICLDMDTAWSSFYMYFDMGGTKKLTFTAPWDFDSAFGYSIGETNILITSYAYNSALCGCPTPKNYTNPWLLLLVNEDWFNNKLVTKWQEIKGVCNKLIENIDAICQNYQEEINNNFIKWPACNTHSEASHGYYEYERNVTHSTSTEYLKNFITKRFEYLNTIFVKSAED